MLFRRRRKRSVVEPTRPLIRDLYNETSPQGIEMSRAYFDLNTGKMVGVPEPSDPNTPTPPMGEGVMSLSAALHGLPEDILSYKPRFPYGKTSLERLETVDRRHQIAAMKVADKYDTSIIEGHRSVERQLELYEQRPRVTHVKFGKHNVKPSMAIDMAPYPIDWSDEEQMVEFGYFVLGVYHGIGVPCRWGGDFDRDMEWRDSTFFDLVHFEIDEPLPNSVT